jgi:Methionine synthase II (cobalamin-independent)
LREAYKEYAGGRMSDAGFAHAQDDAVKTAVRVQEDAGLDAVTDGEYRRRSWFAGFVDSVEGLTHKETSFAFMEDGEAAISVPVPHVDAPIRRTNGICTHELDFVQQVATGRSRSQCPRPR